MQLMKTTHEATAISVMPNRSILMLLTIAEIPAASVTIAITTTGAHVTRRKVRTQIVSSCPCHDQNNGAGNLVLPPHGCQRTDVSTVCQRTDVSPAAIAIFPLIAAPSF